jgi:hypothetical protein
LAKAGDLYTRLAVRLGQNDPLTKSYNKGLGALDSLLPLVELMKGPHQTPRRLFDPTRPN